MTEYYGECDAFVAREICADWHGGQWSAMYSYLSSGHIDKSGLLHEIAECIRTNQETTEHRRLTEFREWVEAQDDESGDS